MRNDFGVEGLSNGFFVLNSRRDWTLVLVVHLKDLLLTNTLVVVSDGDSALVNVLWWRRGE